MCLLILFFVTAFLSQIDSKFADLGSERSGSFKRRSNGYYVYHCLKDMCKWIKKTSVAPEDSFRINALSRYANKVAPIDTDTDTFITNRFDEDSLDDWSRIMFK